MLGTSSRVRWCAACVHRGIRSSTFTVVSFSVKGRDAADVGTMLDVDHNIATRTGLHCAPLIHEHLGTAPRGTVRMSVGPLNTREDTEAAVRAVTEIAGDA